MSLAHALVFGKSQQHEPAQRPVRVLTLTPFYPSEEDPTQGCFVADPLKWTEELGTSNELIAVQPFYRKQLHSIRSDIPAQWKTYFSIPGNLGLPSAGRFLAKTLLAGVHRLHRARPFDLIHAHAALPCGRAAMQLAEQLGIPFLVTVHGRDTFAIRQSGRALSSWSLKATRDVYRRACAVICISEKVRACVAEHVSANTVVIYNGVDANFFSPSLDRQTSLTVLSVGNLIPIKDHALLLRAFSKSSAAVPDSRLEIIGDGPERKNLFRLAADLGISAKVSFLGRQSRALVAEAMRRCAVFALPSRYEGLGCVYLEAMSSGKSAIGCKGQGIDEIIEDGRNGVLISARDESGLSEALQGLLQSENLRSRIGASARRTILERHTLEHQARQLAGLYQECVR